MGQQQRRTFGTPNLQQGQKNRGVGAVEADRLMPIVDAPTMDVAISMDQNDGNILSGTPDNSVLAGWPESEGAAADRREAIPGYTPPKIDPYAGMVGF